MNKKRGKVEFYIDKKKEYRWRLIASNGRIIADSGEGYTTFQNCGKGFNSVISHAEDAERIKKF